MDKFPLHLNALYNHSSFSDKSLMKILVSSAISNKKVFEKDNHGQIFFLPNSYTKEEEQSYFLSKMMGFSGVTNYWHLGQASREGQAHSSEDWKFIYEGIKNSNRLYNKIIRTNMGLFRRVFYDSLDSEAIFSTSKQSDNGQNR